MNYTETKQWLKDNAINIRNLRTQTKESNRDFSKVSNGKSPYTFYYNDKKVQNIFKIFNDNVYDLWKLRQEYRARHVAYSLSRGNKIEQIDRNFDKSFVTQDTYKYLSEILGISKIELFSRDHIKLYEEVEKAHAKRKEALHSYKV